IEALGRIEAKRIAIDGTSSEVVVQHNPARIRSTSARVDAQSVAARKCFLCPENMPPEEKCVQYVDDLMIACNPYPVLERHLSIVHRDHIEQKIDGNLELIFGLARDFGPDYFVLYNGPQSGASAPDHLHFQACSRSLLPIETDLKRHPDFGGASVQTGKELPRAHLLDDCGRSVFVFASNAIEQLADEGYSTISRLADDAGDNREPMLNIVVTFDQPYWVVYLFPRAKHRPASFFAEGEEKLTVSPGAIDMAGVIVVPSEHDFNKLDSNRVASVFAEVSFDLDRSKRIVSSLRTDFERGE
ncbi:MAG: DUF4922 domain-containing protein, partial [Blastocatellia bacterium]